MEFVGLAGWGDDSGKIDFDTPHGVVDLHNNAVMREIRLQPGVAELVLEFRYAADWRMIESAGVPVWLTFGAA